MISGASGRIITFYSYKGGTGRTLALANMAWVLANNGLRVLAIDWDLEAPGLHRFLKPFLIDSELESTTGLIDYVWDLARSTLVPASGNPTRRSDYDDEIQPVSLSENAVRLDWDFVGNGYIDFLPAGQQGGSYAKRVNSFDWDNFYDRLGGGHLLDRARDQLRAEYDYVLIDSRTGVSDTSGICTVQMPDTLVGCFTLNNQSIEGLSAILRSVVTQRSHRSLDVFPLMTRVELSEQEKVQAARRRAREVFEPYVREFGDSRGYWSDMEVLYHPYYAYEEILAAFGDAAGEEGSATSLLASIERMSRRVTGDKSVAMPAVPDGVRREVLNLYAYYRSGGEEGTKPSGMAAYGQERLESLRQQFAAWLRSDMDPGLLLSGRQFHSLRRLGINVGELESPEGVEHFVNDSFAAEKYQRFIRLTAAVLFITIATAWGYAQLQPHLVWRIIGREMSVLATVVWTTAAAIIVFFSSVSFYVRYLPFQRRLKLSFAEQWRLLLGTRSRRVREELESLAKPG